jgi:hypothetical protein
MTLADFGKAAGLHRQSIVYNEKRDRLPRHAHAAERIGEALAPSA